MKTKILLKESEMPTHWYNVAADLANPPAPYLGPDGNPVPPEAMLSIFPEALVMQDAAVQKALDGGSPKKLIVVPGRIVNVVV